MEGTMPESITISELDEATANWIDQEARRRGANKETVALNLIRKGIQCERDHIALQTYDDLDSLAGTWSEEQGNEFLGATREFDQVDEKLWR
jgi:hypothetical protein